jgi:hypothetical protein
MVPEGSGVAEGQKGGVAEVQRLEEIVSRRLVTPRFPPKMLSPQPNEGSVPWRRTKVVCLSGERWWGDGRVEDVDATTQNRAESKKEQPKTEHRDA